MGEEAWADVLGAIKLAINSTEAAATGESPEFLSFGQQPRLPVDLALDLPPQVPAPAAFAARMQDLVRVIREKLTRAKEVVAKYANRHRREVEFAVGDKVYSIHETFA